MPTTNKEMSDMMRKRRDEMAAIPDEPEPVEESPAAESTETAPDKFTVAAPGETSTGEQFEYEPMVDTPGAWVVYPPGVPCDDTAYRIQMDSPAAAGDFDGMAQALREAGDTSIDTAMPASGPPTPSTEDVY